MNGNLTVFCYMFRQLILPRCSFTFDPDNFPDPKAYLTEIKQKYGVKICLWSKPQF
jgi:alpha-glucosidase (family GH31 glycosyl hydrolase)